MKIKSIQLKAHVLLSAIVISIIISIIIGSLLLLHYHKNTEWIKYKTKEKLRWNLESATNIILGDTEGYSFPFDRAIDLFGTNEDSVHLINGLWGIYNIASITAYYRGDTLERIFFYGSIPDDTLQASLYLVNHHRPLQVSGSTALTGDAYLPKSGIKAAVIDGASYQGNQLVNGNIFKSDTVFPFIDDMTVRRCYEILNKCGDEAFQRSHMAILSDSISHSFSKETQYYFIPNNSNLSATYISGRTVLFSDSNFIIKKDSKLENAIVVGRDVVIENGFEGTVQVLASRSITIGDKCRLGYPSAICLLKDSISNYQGIVAIGKETIITGTLFVNASRTDRYKSIVKLETNSVFNGVLYVHGFLETKGKIYGTAIADYFMHQSIISTYENTLVDAVVDRTKLPASFVGSTLVKRPGQLKVIKWLN